MNNPTPKTTLRSFSELPLKRDDLVRLINLGLQQNEPQYARIAALAWLTAYPGDLPVTLLHAKAMLAQGLNRQALPILDNLCQTDPELLEAFELLSTARAKMELASAAEADAAILALGGTPKHAHTMPKWAGMIRSARQTSLNASHAKSTHSETDVHFDQTDAIHKALLENPATPLAAVTHLRHMQATHPIRDAVQGLAQAYNQRWPRCLQFSLILADCLMGSGDSERAVALLHQAAAQDVTGEVARRIWNGENRYASLWPADLEIEAQNPSAPQRIPIPAAVAAALGWNQLATTASIAVPAGEYDPGQDVPNPQAYQEDESVQAHVAAPSREPEYVSESVREVRAALEESAKKMGKPDLGRLDGRFPQYVILSSRVGLEKAYGLEGADQVDAALRQIIPAITRRKTWNCLLYYPDAPQLSSLPVLRRQPAVSAGDPWAFKLALADLDKILAEQGEMIGALLIAGGPDVIPFHRLPNPIDDDDPDVLSDNPYSNRDENYFIPEWPVGRLPGGGRGPEELIEQIRNVAAYHTQQAKPLPWPARLWAEIKRRLAEFGLPIPHTISSLGYSAAIWRRASLSVFRPIGDPRALQVSPPVGSVDGESSEAVPPLVMNARLGYFNLHGANDASEWFGQRDPSEPGEAPEYPVALRPEDIPLNGAANGSRKPVIPHIIFSEACYGGQIKNRTSDEAIALRFLKAGSLAVAGSTCISYGSISTPLIAADLLGRTFWRFLGEGYVAGEALRRAKISLAREMHRRQGYLDSEDQKTLISFVLYGDPLAQTDYTGRGPKSTLRTTLPQPIHTVCDRNVSASEPSAVPDEVIASVKSIVSEYLPGMTGARLTYSHERAGCHHAGHSCPSAQFGAKAVPQERPNRQVVVLSKRVEQAQRSHQQIARLTLDSQGKLVKLVVSR